MLLDPSGRALGMDAVLAQLPVPDYVLPGLFLVGVMGLVPIALAVGLARRVAWPWAARLTRGSGHHWAWTGSLALGLVLAAWLALQGALIGFVWPIQFVTAAIAVAIVALTLLPSVRRAFELPRA